MPQRHQLALLSYLDRGGKRAVVVWHRRAGKDSTALNWIAKSAMQRPGTYWHMLPEARQGRKVIWDGIDRQGRRMIDQAFPPHLRLGKPNDAEMRIRLRKGSVFQVVGSDNHDALVGSNPIGVVFSEYSLARPAAWEYLRPILAENHGWALFIFTPRGENHAHDLFRMAQQQPDWFAERLTVEDTGLLAPEIIEAERRAGMPEALIQQEFYCSFSAAVTGSYFGAPLEQAEREGRIGAAAFDPALPVHTAWDLGISDSTAIWFFQAAAGEVRIIDFYENSGQALGHYADVMAGKPYRYGDDFVPHDAKVRELGTGRSRIETLIGLGRRPRLVPAHTLADGINAVRETLPRCWFDRERCAAGLKALKLYQRDWDEERHGYRDRPRHDWTSHAADGFRYLAMAWRDLAQPVAPPGGRRLTVGPANQVTMNDLWQSRPARRRI